jgi:inner membrane protein
MDNVCHTLVGLAVARAGLNTQTRLATATLAIAANLPDVDVLVFATGIPSVAIRRGRTHGVLAQAVLPVAFAGLMLWVGRLKTGGLRPAPANLSWLLVLSYIGVLSHVGLDYLNTYGVRLLMPFSNQWFYGDSVFIVDIWMWLLLGAGVLLARNGRTWFSRLGIVLTSIYVVAMVISAGAARTIVLERWTETMGAAPARLMVGPVPINPFRKSMIVDAGDRYVLGRFSWAPRGIAFNPRDIPKNNDSPWIEIARRENPDFDYILIWSRFPYWEISDDESGTRVTLKDARFPQGLRGFSATTYIRKAVASRRRAGH